MSKSSNITVIQRVRVVSKLLIAGNSREDIVQFIAGTWELCERQADNYIKKANELISKSVKKEVNHDYAKAIIRFEELYKLSLERKDYKTASTINKELASLQGLYKGHIEHSGEVQFICTIPD